MRSGGHILLVSAVVGSVCLHAAVLNVAVRLSSVEIAGTDEAIEVALIEEVPPVPEPPAEMPPPEPSPPAPEPLPVEPEEVLATAEPEKVAPPPVVPKAVKIPQPVQQPRPAPRPAVAKAITSEARPDHSRNPPPRYPELARRNGWEGQIMVRVRVSPQGRVVSAEITRASSYGILDQAALRAVKTWIFRPRMAGGHAVEAVVEVPVNFSLRR